MHSLYDTDIYFESGFEISVEYTPGPAGPSKDIKAIYDDAGALITIGEALIINENPTLQVRTADVKDLDNRAKFKFSLPEFGDEQVERSVLSYTHDGTGITVVELRK